MNTTIPKPIQHTQTALLKRSRLLGLLLAVPLTLAAQTLTPVFTDSFSNGSTANKTSVPSGTPTASATSYDVASTKTATNLLAAGHLKIALNTTTSSGFWEIQALFANQPVALNTVGDYINLTYTFTDTTGSLLPSGKSAIWNGLYNSGGSVPVAGNLANGGLTTATGSPYATGNGANWQGYVSSIINGGGASQAYTRPLQNAGGTASANQDLVGNGVGSGAFNNPLGTVFDATETATVTLTSGGVYTISYTIALTAANTLTVTNVLYSGAGTGGSILFSQTNSTAATAGTYLTNSFDGLAVGVLNKTSGNPTMDLNSITVTKSILPPGPTFTVTGGGTGCPGDAFAVGLSGSVSTNDYYLYTNATFAGMVQTGTGSAISFGPQNVPATYTILASNTVDGVTGLMNGSAVVTIFVGPVITNQPSPVIVAANSAGIFQAGASGDGLVYHWYKNGGPLSDGGDVSGSGTSTLVIYPATSADAATTAQGYYCVITNSCGLAAISVTDSLTLAAPSTIVWQGGNPNNNWDLATTANFTSGGNPVVFHGGDNVTFDDTSVNPVVNIVGNYVAPGVITENASQSYAFTATSRPLFGPGSLVMSGTGSLTISNANAFTGGATLNSGTVVLRSFNFPLGTGLITLAGGTLDIPTSGNATTGVSNNLMVAANSTLQYDQTGTYACVLLGMLSGSPGATLNINLNNFNTATARMRLYSPFTNNANLTLTASSAEIELAPYHASGNQVYNGAISGTGGHIVPRGNGNVILAGQNTFDDSSSLNTGYSLFMSSGNVGFGADSISSSPPTIDSGPASKGNIGINVGVEGGDCSFFANGGAHTVANPILYTSATNTVTVSITGSNNLTLSGAITLSGVDSTGNTNRAFSVSNTGLTTFSGVVGDAGLGCGLDKTGAGTLALTAVNTYTGPTTVGGGTLWINGQIDVGGVTVTNGTLGGAGTILGPVLVNAPGAIAPGTATIGTLTINNSLTLAGNAGFKLNKSLAPSNDLVSVSGTLANTGTGTITVTNLGPALVVGDKFTLFSRPVANGGTLAVSGGGMNWTNLLAVDGSIQALSVASTMAGYSTNITFSVSGGTLTIGWPATHLGWILQSQTNALNVGLTTPINTWYDVPGSASVISTNYPVNVANPTVFYRLRHP